MDLKTPFFDRFQFFFRHYLWFPHTYLPSRSEHYQKKVSQISNFHPGTCPVSEITKIGLPASFFNRFQFFFRHYLCFPHTYLPSRCEHYQKKVSRISNFDPRTPPAHFFSRNHKKKAYFVFSWMSFGILCTLISMFNLSTVIWDAFFPIPVKKYTANFLTFWLAAFCHLGYKENWTKCPIIGDMHGRQNVSAQYTNFSLI